MVYPEGVSTRNVTPENADIIQEHHLSIGGEIVEDLSPSTNPLD